MAAVHPVHDSGKHQIRMHPEAPWAAKHPTLTPQLQVGAHRLLALLQVARRQDGLREARHLLLDSTQAERLLAGLASVVARHRTHMPLVAEHLRLQDRCTPQQKPARLGYVSKWNSRSLADTTVWRYTIYCSNTGSHCSHSRGISSVWSTDTGSVRKRANSIRRSYTLRSSNTRC